MYLNISGYLHAECLLAVCAKYSAGTITMVVWHSERNQRVCYSPTIPLGHCAHKCSVIITEVNKPWLQNNPLWSILARTHMLLQINTLVQCPLLSTMDETISISFRSVPLSRHHHKRRREGWIVSVTFFWVLKDFTINTKTL